jgi:hypothetical protein
MVSRLDQLLKNMTGDSAMGVVKRKKKGKKNVSNLLSLKE